METTNAAPESALQPKAHLTGKVIKTTIAGAIVDIGQKVPGVIHISQLQKGSVNRVEDVVQVGQTIDIWVRRVHDDRIELTMVEPLMLEWREMKPDMLVKGKVERLEAYGAFVDIGAERPGLVHVSEISHDYVKNPSEVLKVGDEVEAKILDVDRRKKQIRLSIKAALPKPEEVLAEVDQTGTSQGPQRRKVKSRKNLLKSRNRTNLNSRLSRLPSRRPKNVPASAPRSGRPRRIHPGNRKRFSIAHLKIACQLVDPC